MDIWESVVGNAPEVVEMLVTVGEVDVNERNDFGETGLHLAASRGFDAVVDVLIKHGADLSARDWESGWTPLHRSVYNEHLSTSLLLLRYARELYGRKFMKEYLYETRDMAQRSAMELISLKEEVVEGETRRGGMVYTFGKVDFQLGYHLPNVNVQSSPRLVELPITSSIVQISASKFHTVALNERGQVFVWGFGKGGRLGTGTEFDHVEPVRITSLDEIPILKVSAGENHTLALSRSGQVFSWGSNSFGQLGHNMKATTQESRLTPKRIDAFRGMVMAEVTASGCHSGAICRDKGIVYTWGSNKRGQLGRKDGFGSDQPNPTPKPVDRLIPGHPLSVIYETHDALRAVQVAMSDVHTCVLLQSSRNGQRYGQVWQFGYGMNVPTRLHFKEKRRANSSVMMTEAWIPRSKRHGTNIVAVSCAPNHSIALSVCGEVYTWGHNGDALSHRGKDAAIPGAPQQVALERFGEVVSICASQDHCAVVTRQGDLVTWGCGPEGVLGHGPGNSWQPSPKQVHGAKKVVAVAAGHQHTVVLVAPKTPASSDPSHHFEDNEISSPPKLRVLLEHRIADYIDISNVATVWKYASAYSQTTLERYCADYMRRNCDALLEMGGRDRLDMLFELILPPLVGVVTKRPVSSLPASDKTQQLGDLTKSEKATRYDDVPARKINGMVALQQPCQEQPLASAVEARSSPIDKPQKDDGGSRKKPTKFVSLDAFLAEGRKPHRKFADPATTSSDMKSPWMAPTTNSISTPRAAPLSSDHLVRPRPNLSESGYSASPKLVASPSPQIAPARNSVVLCPDGSERIPVSTFSLDAFVKKKPMRKNSRSDSMDVPNNQATWGGAALPVRSVSGSPVAKKSLKEIQAEEEAQARADAEAKAKNGGFVRQSSTINSWGRVEQQRHISLAELQKIEEEKRIMEEERLQREEEERFVEEQRQILAQIERENARRLEVQHLQRGSRKGGKAKGQCTEGQSESTTDGGRRQKKSGKKSTATERENALPNSRCVSEQHQAVYPDKLSSARRSKRALAGQSKMGEAGIQCGVVVGEHQTGPKEKMKGGSSKRSTEGRKSKARPPGHDRGCAKKVA